MAKRLYQAITGSILGEQQNELLANTLQLSAACPFDQTNPQDCPLFPLRKMKPTKRWQWLHALPEDDLSYLAAYHRVCFNVKGESGLAEQRLES
jgi:hypothetical protein